MKIALVCPASLPATQFGGIMFLCIHIAKKLSNDAHTLTIYTTDPDFGNNTNSFNRNLPREEKIENFTIKRSHVWFSIFLFFINPGIFKQMLSDNFDINSSELFVISSFMFCSSVTCRDIPSSQVVN